MARRVCPWWLGYWLICPLRMRRQHPKAILSPYVHEGMTVLEPGPGMGFFTLELARLVGPSGRVIATDLQPAMIARLKRRAGKAGLLDRIDARAASPRSLNVSDLNGSLDFTLAFAVVHEIADVQRFFSEVAAASKPGAKLLLAEPTGHVKPSEVEAELKDAGAAGFALVVHPAIPRMQTALLEKAHNA